MISPDTIKRDVDLILQNAYTKEILLLGQIRSGQGDIEKNIDDYIRTKTIRSSILDINRKIQDLVNLANEISIEAEVEELEKI